jgi:hypothetical protein
MTIWEKSTGSGGIQRPDNTENLPDSVQKCMDSWGKLRFNRYAQYVISRPRSTAAPRLHRNERKHRS